MASILSLVIVGAILIAIVRALAARNPGGVPEVHAERDLRDEVVRFFRLALQFAAVVLVAEGIAGLIEEALPRTGELVRDPAAIARALAFTIVGIPVLAGLAAWTRRRLAADPGEIRSTGWGFALAAGLSVSLIVAMVVWHGVLTWTVGAEVFDGGSAGRAVTWTTVWAVHWRLHRQREAAIRPPGSASAVFDVPVLLGAASGLGALCLGAGRALTTALRMVYDLTGSELLVGGGTMGLRRESVAVLSAGAVWWWYWSRHGERAERGSRWYAYVLLAGVAAPLAVTLVGAARLVYMTLDWFFATPDAVTADAAFSSVPSSVATMAVGVAAWTYHRWLIDDDAARARAEADRVYEYLASAVGLVVTAIGVTVAFVALAESVTDRDTIVAGGGLADTVVLAVTLVGVGIPVWGWFWRRAQGHAGDVGERASVTRRVYLLLLFGVAAVVALVSLVVALLIGLEDVARGTAGASTVFRIRVPAGLVLTMGVIGAYHAAVYREDRAALAMAGPGPQTATATEIVLLASEPQAADVASALRSRTGAHVRIWHPVEPVVAPPPVELLPAEVFPVDVDALLESVAATRCRHVLVELTAEGVRVQAFRPVAGRQGER